MFSVRQSNSGLRYSGVGRTRHAHASVEHGTRRQFFCLLREVEAPAETILVPLKRGTVTRTVLN